MNNVKGVIFDMDGVVVDNHAYHFKAWEAFTQKYKIEFNADIYRDQYNGKTNADLFKMIFGKDISPEDISKCAGEKEGLYRELYRPHIRCLHGLTEFIDYLERRRIKVALGTSAPPANVNFILDNLFIRKYFPIIVDGSQVTNGKPDPEIYKTCCLKLGLEPYQCVVFEDSLAGLESGERAGCKVVGVATSHRPAELRSKADKIIIDFTEAKAVMNFR